MGKIMSTKKKDVAQVHHPLALLIRERLASSRGQWPAVARAAGITPRSLHALSQGTMREMVVSRELRLAEALGIKIKFRVPH
jgi:peptidyl-tRNA hydrolase